MKTLFDMSQKQKRKMNRSGEHIICQSYCYHKKIKKNYFYCSFSYVFMQKKKKKSATSAEVTSELSNV